MVWDVAGRARRAMIEAHNLAIMRSPILASMNKLALEATKMPNKTYDPWVYIREISFGQRPLIIGEAPGPGAPDHSWPPHAKSTKNLAALIFGSTGNVENIHQHFDLKNVFQHHPGRQDSRSKFSFDAAEVTLETLASFGAFSDRVTFFLGTRINSAFAQSVNFSPAFSSRAKYNSNLGWIDWVPVQSEGAPFGLYLVVPHPSNWGSTYPLHSLAKLSALFRAAIGLSPLPNFSSIIFA
jgi:hypothetical protein